MTSLRFRGESDDDLMRRAQDNDSDAFGELYDRHSVPALIVALAVCRDRSLAEEALQEGFLSIWRGRGTYRTQAGDSFRGWAVQSVRNRAIDAGRSRVALKRPSEEQLPGIELAGKGPSPVDTMIEREERDTLFGLLTQLPAAQAEVIALAYFGEMSHTEISAQLGLPPGTVKGRIRLGMEKLRATMEVAA